MYTLISISIYIGYCTIYSSIIRRIFHAETLTIIIFMKVTITVRKKKKAAKNKKNYHRHTTRFLFIIVCGFPNITITYTHYRKDIPCMFMFFQEKKGKNKEHQRVIIKALLMHHVENIYNYILYTSCHGNIQPVQNN